MHGLRQKAQAVFGLPNAPLQGGELRLEKRHPENGGELEGHADLAARIALLDAVQQVAGNAGTLGKRLGADPLLDASSAPNRTKACCV